MKKSLLLTLFVIFALFFEVKSGDFDVKFDYKINNHKRAHQILDSVIRFQPVQSMIYRNYTLIKLNYSEPFMDLKIDDFYCKGQMIRFVKEPALYAEKGHFFSDYPLRSFVRDVVFRNMGEIMHYELFYGSPKITNDTQYSLSDEINFIMDIRNLYSSQDLGKNFGCLFQEYSKIPGSSVLGLKNLVAIMLYEYGQRFTDKPQCFDANKFSPRSWVLDIPEQCLDFFENHLNTEEYKIKKEKEGMQFIAKNPLVHRGEGIYALNSTNEDYIRSLYYQGDKKCNSEEKHHFLIQQYIKPLLLMNRKFDIRMYLLVSSTSPLIAWSHEGFVKLNIHPYDANSEKTEMFAANTYLSKDYFDSAEQGEKVYGMNYDELSDFQLWDFEKMQDYLLKEGKISDPNWLHNYLFPTFKKAMLHLTLATKWSFFNASQIFDFWGIDFILDEDLNVYFIEANPNPMLTPTNEQKAKKLQQMLVCMIDLQLAYLRSRLKRIVLFVNKVDMEIGEGSVRHYIHNNQDKLREDFAKISKNYLEVDYRPSKWNMFEPIYDANLQNADKRTKGLISEECLVEDFEPTEVLYRDFPRKMMKKMKKDLDDKKEKEKKAEQEKAVDQDL